MGAGAWILHRKGEKAEASTGASPGFCRISLAACNTYSCVSGSIPLPSSNTHLHLHPLCIRIQVPRLVWAAWASPPGHRNSHPGALWRGSPGEPVGVTCLLPTPQECTVLSGPPGFLCRESARHSKLLCPVGTRSASPSKGWRLAARACCHTPARREPQARDQAVQTEEGGHSCFPALPTPSPSPCLRPCWIVTRVMARACPNSRNTRSSPQGFPQPQALFR